SQAQEPNSSVILREVLRRQHGGHAELQCILDLQRNSMPAGPLPLAVNLNGARSEVEVKMEGQAMRFRHRIDLGENTNGGWGSFELPADANIRDNVAFFVYGPEVALRASTVSSDPVSGR